jgi:hypothetical protein
MEMWERVFAAPKIWQIVAAHRLVGMSSKSKVTEKASLKRGAAFAEAVEKWARAQRCPLFHSLEIVDS